MELFNKIDEGMMRGVNTGVRVWNWTTGKTKADLANDLLTIAPILESVGMANRGLYIIIPGLLYISHIVQKENTKIEKKESRAIENNALDFEVEKYKLNSKVNALIFTPSALFWGTYHPPKQGIFLPDAVATDYCTSLGHVLRSASYCVMCADYLPPRKDVLSRATDKLKEWAKEIAERPIGLPAPAYGFSICKPLEEKVI